MIVLTPAERRVVLLLVLLLALGAAWDLMSGRGPVSTPIPADSSWALAPGAAQPSTARSVPEPRAVDGPLDLNRATARQLDDLPGIGPVLAGRILDHRRRFGSFRTVEDLRAIRGIGPRLFERLRTRLRVGPGADSSRRGEVPLAESPKRAREP
jgi:competence ComEA-like helix-hairpin-helix protein